MSFHSPENEISFKVKKCIRWDNNSKTILLFFLVVATTDVFEYRIF